jgi:two-component system, NtrC family, nitrogen regulation sensor histidine kinase NtrY
MNRRQIIILSFVAATLLILALIADSIYFSDFEYRYRTRQFNRILHEKETIMEECLNGIKPLLADEDHHGSIPENDLFLMAARNKITILEFLDNKLVHWSDNDFDIPAFYDDSVYRKPVVFLQNGWFLPGTIEAGTEKVVGLLRVRTDYSLSNEVVRSGFEKEFRVSEQVKLNTSRKASEFHIINKSGQFLFCLVFPEVKQATGFIFVPVILWTGFLFVLIIICFEIVKLLVSRGKQIVAISFAILFCTALYLGIVLAGIPGSISLTELFSPYRFSFSSIIPSLGHLVILSILASFMAIIFFRYVSIRENAGSRTFLIVFFITAAFFLSTFQYLFSQLILTSNINFQPYKILDLNIFSLTGFASVLLLALLPVLFMLNVIRSFMNAGTKTLVLFSLPGLAVIAAFNYKEPLLMVALAVFYVSLVICTHLVWKRRLTPFNTIMLLSFVFGLYSLYVITLNSEDKITENNKIHAVAFSTENDPEAEHLILDLWPEISSDTLLAGMMKMETFNESNEDVEEISNYLRETYFSGYWANFNFNIVLCRNDDPLRVGPGNEVFPVCFNFFDARIKRDGQRITGTEFYFIDNQRGRSYYLGRLMYEAAGNFIHGLFIELYGDVNVFQPGYSSILLDEKYRGYAGLKDYSFAKYINGEIVLMTGEFPYDKNDSRYVEKTPDYRIFSMDSYRHVLFKNGNATVIISRPLLTAGDMVIAFAYLFAFILLFSGLVFMLVRRPSIKIGNTLNFRQKLQISYVGILLFSFLLIGVVVAYLTINQYQTKHYENIKEKLNSVYLELDSRLAMEKHLDDKWRDRSYSSLNDLLISLSNIFNTDINLYDTNGELIATSRPEIFYRNLTSTRINNMARIYLADLKMPEVYQREKIGNLEYLSAYVPFFNTDDRILAYLNLPYFRIQSVLAQEISNLVVAVMNFTLLLVLITMALAVVISGRLTGPLSMLGEGLASVQLGRKTEHLSYKGNDEIGELVRQYNRMVDEISESARKLADSEREYAWREMAKQIAHEIKNPLTPMKLNVQQLLKAWRDKDPDFNERMEQYARNQVEYIDNLSSIATAFSSFAKMPQANPVEVNLIEQIKVTLELFRDAGKIRFRVIWPEEEITVLADKEHLNGIFSNLIKNSIQSIPPGREGIIDVKAYTEKGKAVVSIQDNGSGIPPELRKNMFTPNFTTKSSGMGLGLSIVKKYVETAGGRVWYESETGRGTAFYVELPLKRN